jgi:hypothetical protein
VSACPRRKRAIVGKALRNAACRALNMIIVTVAATIARCLFGIIE